MSTLFKLQILRLKYDWWSDEKNIFLSANAVKTGNEKKKESTHRWKHNLLYAVNATSGLNIYTETQTFNLPILIFAIIFFCNFTYSIFAFCFVSDYIDNLVRYLHFARLCLFNCTADWIRITTRTNIVCIVAFRAEKLPLRLLTVVHASVLIVLCTILFTRAYLCFQRITRLLFYFRKHAHKHEI